MRHACRALGPDVDPVDLPAAISEAALEGRCEQCGEALEMFVEAYGAEAGNLALRTVATAGVYIGGGIAPKILPALEGGAFLAAFHDKEPMADLMRTLPVQRDPEPGGRAARRGDQGMALMRADPFEVPEFRGSGVRFRVLPARTERRTLGTDFGTSDSGTRNLHITPPRQVDLPDTAP